MNIANRLRQFASILWQSRLFIVDAAMYILGGLVGFAAFVVSVLWFAAYFGDVSNAYIGATPFTLAQVMAIFGGFGIAAGFANFGSSELKDMLRRAGVLYLLSALGFSMLGMMSPTLADEHAWKVLGWFLYIAGSAALVTALAGFFLGTWLWISQVHKLIGSQSDADTNGDS